MKKTYTTSARANIEDVATIARYAIENKYRITNKSDPIRIGVEMAAEIIRKNYPHMTYNIVEATQLLKNLGIDVLRMKSRGALIKGLQDYELSISGHNEDCDVTSIPQPKIHGGRQSPVFASEEDIKKAEERRKKELAEAMESFKNVNNLDIE